MPSFIDLTGKRFGMLTVIEKSTFNGKYKKPKIYWECICDCGTKVTSFGASLRKGRTTTCGCRLNRYKHRMYGTKEYKAWAGMKARVHDTKGDHKKYYFDKGIDIDPLWNESFEAFYQDMGAAPSPEHSVDRINGSLGYWKFNCRWATCTEQLRNRGTYNKLITYNGKTQCIAKWEDEYGMKRGCLNNRLRIGWDVERALLEQVRPMGDRMAREITHNGKTQSVTDWAKELGLNRRLIYNRLNAGWDVEKALTSPLLNPIDNLSKKRF